MKGPFAHLVDIPEGRLVDAIFADDLLRHPLGVPPSIRGPFDVRLRVRPAQLGLANHLFGDVDALLLERTGTVHASAVQFKRVKVTSASLGTGLVNKLKGLKKAAKQVNALRSVGFGYVWLTVLVVADVRPLTQGVGFAPTPGRLIKLVDDAIPMDAIDPSIGVQRCELTQVSNAPANERGGAGWQLLRSAEAQTQPPQLTEGIKSLLRGYTAS